MRAIVLALSPYLLRPLRPLLHLPATTFCEMGKGADRKKRWKENKRAEGLTNSMIQPKSGGSSGAGSRNFSVDAGQGAHRVLPALTPSLLAVDSEFHAVQLAFPSVHGQPSAAKGNVLGRGDVPAAAAEPPNAERHGEEYAAAWLRYQTPSASVRWLNDDSEAQEDHDVEIRAGSAELSLSRNEIRLDCGTKWIDIEVKTRWEGHDPRMNLMSGRQRERLQDPDDSYMLLVVGDAHRLFESPASPPSVHLYGVSWTYDL